MLHAVAQKKSRHYRRYLGDRDHDEGNVQSEDEITSSVLGPLSFMNAVDVHSFWLQVLFAPDRPSFLPETPPSKIDVAMWPRRDSNIDDGSVEPDVVINMTWANGTCRILLIELKWRAALSGDDQLRRQWMGFLTESERADALHLFIAPDISAGLQAINAANNNVWSTPDGFRLVLLPWSRIRSITSKLAKVDSSVGPWARVVDKFLESIQIKKFTGFKFFCDDLALPAHIPISLSWRPNRFTALPTQSDIK